MLSIENLFVMDPHIMDLGRIVDLGKQMNLAGKELLEFVLAKQALARDERIRISQEKKEARIAEEAEKARQRKKEDEARSAEEAAWIRRHKAEEEERIRRHEEEMCHLRREADNIRRRRMLQEVWEDAEERRREEEGEGECSISVTDRELWRKCFVSKKRWHWRKQKRLDNTRNTGYNACTNGCSGRRKTWRRRLRRLLSYSR